MTQLTGMINGRGPGLLCILEPHVFPPEVKRNRVGGPVPLFRDNELRLVILLSLGTLESLVVARPVDESPPVAALGRGSALANLDRRGGRSGGDRPRPSPQNRACVAPRDSWTSQG